MTIRPIFCIIAVAEFVVLSEVAFVLLRLCRTRPQHSPEQLFKLG